MKPDDTNSEDEEKNDIEFEQEQEGKKKSLLSDMKLKLNSGRRKIKTK